MNQDDLSTETLIRNSITQWTSEISINVTNKMKHEGAGSISEPYPSALSSVKSVLWRRRVGICQSQMDWYDGRSTSTLHRWPESYWWVTLVLSAIRWIAVAKSCLLTSHTLLPFTTSVPWTMELVMGTWCREQGQGWCLCSPISSAHTVGICWGRNVWTELEFNHPPHSNTLYTGVGKMWAR